MNTPKLLSPTKAEIWREFWALLKNKSFENHLEDYLLSALGCGALRIEESPPADTARVIFHAALLDFTPPESRYYDEIRREIKNLRLFI